jgi:hypothetical protein
MTVNSPLLKLLRKLEKPYEMRISAVIAPIALENRSKLIRKYAYRGIE